MVAVKTDVIILKSLKSDNKFSVSIDYALRQLRKHELSQVKKSIRNLNSVKSEDHDRSNGHREPLSSLIDRLLLKGGLTMRGLAREIRRKDSVSCKGKDVRANIRARIYWFKRKGYRIERNERGWVRIVAKNGLKSI